MGVAVVRNYFFSIKGSRTLTFVLLANRVSGAPTYRTRYWSLWEKAEAILTEGIYWPIWVLGTLFTKRNHLVELFSLCSLLASCNTRIILF